MQRGVSFGVALLLSCTPAGADDIFTNRPALSEPEQPAQAYARCEQIRPMLSGMTEPDDRIDLSVVGELTLVRTDGALWYLGLCTDIQVLCVTYESNDMKPGERVFMKGGYIRRSPDHILLDPCLATRREPGE